MKLFIWLSLVCFFACNSVEKNIDPEWETLFNGYDLSDWTMKIRGHDVGENFQNTFIVEDSLLTVSYDEYDSFRSTFGHIFYNKTFSWYRLRVVYRFIGDQLPDGPGWAYRNSGIMLHGQRPQSMGLDQDFPMSIEVQLLGGNGETERSTANLCTPGTNVVYDGKLTTQHCINSNSATYHGDQWVEAEVLVYGDSLIEHFVEGEKVLTYENPQLGGGSVSGHDPALLIDGKFLESGTISLQSESHPVQFKTVELLNLKGCLDPDAKNYKPYFLKHDPGSCIY